MTHQADSTGRYLVTFLALMVLLALTVAASFIHLGRLNWLAALSVSTVKTLLIAYYFMHLRTTSRLTWMAAVAGCVMLVILTALILTDSWTRSWLS
jgi:cytochrome c oxidase subunit 4